MNIFEKRPLGLILCVMLGGFSLFAFFPPLIRSILLASSLSLIVFAFAIKNYGMILKILSIALLVSFLLSYLYFEVYFYPNDLYAEENEYTARVIDNKGYESGFQSITVKTEKIGNENRRIKLNINVYGLYYEIKPGYVIKFKAELSSLKSSEDFDFEKYYTSRGVCGSADVTMIEIKSIDNAPLGYKFKRMREDIAERAVSFSNKDAGAMLSALLLGERDRLSGQLNLDFARTGITHILALSGTHVVILAAAVDRILAAFRVGRKYRLVFGSIFTFLFMALTGFPFSVCRAGMMLIISTILFMITGCKDSITSLAVASALIIAISPYSSQDVGLWLSILATFGILISAEMLNRDEQDTGGIKKLYKYVSLSFIFSLFAISATVILSTLSFTGTSPLSAIATLIFSILTELYVYLGVVVLLIGGVVPIGKVLIRFEVLISNLIGKLSDFSFAYASTEFSVVKIIFIALGISFAVFALAKINRKKAFLIYLSTLFIFANILPIGMTNQVKSGDKFEVVSQTNDKILLRTDGVTTLFDISNSSKNAAYLNNYFLIKEKIADLDYYVVLNYYSSLPNSLNKILSNNLVKEVKLPTPRYDDEFAIAVNANRVLNEYRTEISFYDDSEGFSVSGFDVTVSYRKDNVSVIDLKRGNEIYTYISRGALSHINHLDIDSLESDYVIFGGYGKSYNGSEKIDEFDKRVKIVVVFDNGIIIETEKLKYKVSGIYYPENAFSFYGE